MLLLLVFLLQAEYDSILSWEFRITQISLFQVFLLLAGPCLSKPLNDDDENDVSGHLGPIHNQGAPLYYDTGHQNYEEYPGYDGYASYAPHHDHEHWVKFLTFQLVQVVNIFLCQHPFTGLP